MKRDLFGVFHLKPDYNRSHEAMTFQLLQAHKYDFWRENHQKGLFRVNYIIIILC
jgi:hypothetical protein